MSSPWQQSWQGQRPNRPPSPRPGRRDQSPRGHGKGKESKGNGKNKAKYKGKGKGKDKMLTSPEDGEPPKALPPPYYVIAACSPQAAQCCYAQRCGNPGLGSLRGELLQALAPLLRALESLPSSLREQLAGFSDLSRAQCLCHRRGSLGCLLLYRKLERHFPRLRWMTETQPMWTTATWRARPMLWRSSMDNSS